jgi:hypothetical protein
MAHKTLSLYSWNVFNFVCDYKAVACFQDHEGETVLILYFGQYSMQFSFCNLLAHLGHTCFVLSLPVLPVGTILHIRCMFSSTAHS